ncbi:MAG: MBL fold metallo-hydrolase [Gammaproteobacteria bacterium]
MKLVFIGSGAAFTVDNYNSNMFLENSAHEKLLIDCGSDARHALNDLGLSHADVTSVYVSHLHADHAGGLEWLGFSRMFNMDSAQKPALYIHESLEKPLWEHTLSGGLNTLDDVTAKLSTYFDVTQIRDDKFNWAGLEITLVKTIHTMTDGIPSPSFGLYFTTDGLKVLITTDTQFSPDYYNELYQTADIIFHDCETSERKSGVHATYQQLITLDPKIRAKLWLYHYNDNNLPNAKKDGFRGFVKKGQCFDFSDVSTLK